jgi:hypothetical protein
MHEDADTNSKSKPGAPTEKGFLARIQWQVQRWFAIAGYNSRERRRDALNFPTVWRSQIMLLRDDIRLIHGEFPELIEGNLLTGLVDVRDTAKKKSVRRIALTITLVIYLGLMELGVSLPVTIAGVNLQPIPGASELIILAVAYINASLLPVVLIQFNFLLAIREIIALKHSKEVVYFWEVIHSGGTIPGFYIPSMMPQLQWKWAVIVINALFMFVLVLVMVGLVVGSIAWRWYIYQAIVSEPLQAAFVSYSAVFVATLADVTVVLIMLMYIVPLPYRDYSALQELKIAEQTNKDTHAAIRARMFGESVRDRARLVEAGFMGAEEKI